MELCSPRTHTKNVCRIHIPLLSSYTVNWFFFETFLLLPLLSLRSFWGVGWWVEKGTLPDVQAVLDDENGCGGGDPRSKRNSSLNNSASQLLELDNRPYTK